MRRWEERPIEVANLLNPAFCGRLLYQSIVGHTEYESKSCLLCYTLLREP